MENFSLTGSDKTPYFRLSSHGELIFGGISMPEDAASFYYGIIDWITDYYRKPNENTQITVKFRYLNSSSSSMVMKMFYAFKRLQATGKTNIKCTWYYEKEDLCMRDYADQIAREANNIDFELKEVSELPMRYELEPQLN